MLLTKEAKPQNFCAANQFLLTTPKQITSNQWFYFIKQRLREDQKRGVASEFSLANLLPSKPLYKMISYAHVVNKIKRWGYKDVDAFANLTKSEVENMFTIGSGSKPSPNSLPIALLLWEKSQRLYML